MKVHVNDAVNAALNLRLQIPREVIKYQPATAVNSVATMIKDGRRTNQNDFGGDPWDSDDDSYIPSNHVTPRDPSEVHEAKDEKIQDVEDGDNIQITSSKKDDQEEEKSSKRKNKNKDKKTDKDKKDGKKNEKGDKGDSKEGEKEEEKDERPKNPITGQPMDIHSSGSALGPVVLPPPAPSRKMSGTVPMQPPHGTTGTNGGSNGTTNENSTNLALSSTFLSQAGIDPNDIHEYSTPRSMTRLYAKAGIAQIKRLMKAGLRPLGALHDGDGQGGTTSSKENDGTEADDEGEEGEEGDEKGDAKEKNGSDEDGSDEEDGSEEEDGSGDEDGSKDSDDSDNSDAISSDESDSDESEISSVDIDAELGLATGGTAAKLAKEAAAKRKAKETWTMEERKIFEFALEDIAEYDETRRWIKIQKRVKTRSLKECKKFMKVLLKEEKSRNREIKSVLKTLCQQVEEDQSNYSQIFDVLITTVQQVEVVEYCRHLFIECANTAVETAPSVVRIENERGRVRREEEMLRKEPWLSLKTQTKQSLPKVLGRAIRSMLRNNTITKPRAHKLVEMYRRAPTLEEEDEAEETAMTLNEDGVMVPQTLTDRSVESMVGEAIALGEYFK